jgi:membrane protease YdiL (CAAX protease family)
LITWCGATILPSLTWVALAGAVLALHNIFGNEVLPDDVYVPANVLTGAALVGIAVGAGASLDDLGLGRTDAPSGLRWGVAIACVVAIGIAFGALLPVTRGLFHDQRVAGISGTELAYETLLRIPVGTALFEEVAFRGVLLALLLRVTSSVPAVAVCSVLFGLWHILPTISTLRVNEVGSGAVGGVGLVGGAVVVTGIGGALFCALRLYTGSLIAPVLVHTATNSLAFAAAFVVQRTD